MTALLLLWTLAHPIQVGSPRPFDEVYSEVLARLFPEACPPGPCLRVRISSDSETFQFLAAGDGTTDMTVSTWRASPGVENQLGTLPQIEREMQERGTDDVSISIESAAAAVRVERRTFTAPRTSRLAQLVRGQADQRVSLASRELLQLHTVRYEVHTRSVSKEVSIRILPSSEATPEETRLIAWVESLQQEVRRLAASQ